MFKIKITVFVFLSFAILISSCKDNTGNKTSEKDSTATQTSGNKAPASPLTNLDQFPILYVQFTDLETAFSLNGGPGQPVRKLQFEFNFDGTALQPTLVGYAARPNGSFIPPAVPIPTFPNAAIKFSTTTTQRNLTYPLNLSDLELTRDNFNQLKNDVNRQPYLLFVPLKSNNANHLNSVTYNTYWSPIMPTPQKIDSILSSGIKPNSLLTVGDELNPSPPATPFF